MGGAEVLTVNLAIELAERGHSILIICMREAKNHTLRSCIEKANLPQISVVMCSTRMRFSFLKGLVSTNAEYENIIRRFDPDVVHSHLFEAEILSRSYIHKRARYITHVHDNVPQYTRPSWKKNSGKELFIASAERKWIMKRYAKSSTHFISISVDVDNYLHHQLSKTFHGKITHLPNAIRTADFAMPAGMEKHESPLMLVTTGSLVRKKNHEFLIKVMGILKSRGIDARLDILGSGPLEGELREKIDNALLSDRIFLRGIVDTVNQYLWKAHIYVHSATYEPLGLALIEAMAAGLPVVCLDGRGNRDLMQEGKNGHLLKEPDPHTFAQLLIRIYSDNKIRNEMGRFAMEYARNHDIGSYADRLVEIMACKTANRS